MKTSQSKTLVLHKTSLVELTDQTIFQINGGSRDLPQSLRYTSASQIIKLN